MKFPLPDTNVFLVSGHLGSARQPASRRVVAKNQEEAIEITEKTMPDFNVAGATSLQDLRMLTNLLEGVANGASVDSEVIVAPEFK